MPGSHWAQIASSFEAVTYTNGSKYLIAYAGTNPTTVADWQANGGLATGLGADQLKQAALYYVRLRVAYPDATIEFTGHSLGGGLAALMGVFFDERAITFDQAPFNASVRLGIRDQIVEFLNVNGYDNAFLAERVPDLGLFTVAGAAPRIAGVTGLFVQREFLQGQPFNTTGVQTMLPHGSSLLTSPADLHSQALLSAFLLNDGFEGVTNRLPDLLRMVFDSALYGRGTGTAEKNFIENLIRHQVGVAGPGAITPDNMLTRFTTDLQKVAQDGGLTLTNELVSKTLVAFAMQKYYEEKAGDPDLGQKLFSDVSGGIRFDRTVVAEQLAAAKGYNLYFKAYLDSLPAADKALIASLLPAVTEWFVQAGGTSLGATAGSQRAFMLGGTGSDALTGGTAADLLVGNLGNDTLNGGAGADALLGGAGTDVYNFTGAWGKDTVLDDSLGLGTIKIDGAAVGIGKGFGHRNQWSADLGSGVTATLTVLDDSRSSTNKQLVITKSSDTTNSNSITINNFDLLKAQGAGYLGITLAPLKLALTEDTGANVFAVLDFDPASLAGRSSTVIEGTGSTFTIYLDQSAAAGDTLTLALSADADKYQVVLGDRTVAANGAVITLAEGQTEVAIALVQTGAEVTSNSTMQFSATFAGAGGTATSNAWGVNLQDAGTIAHIYKGDQRPLVVMGAGGVEEFRYTTESWLPDGTLSGGSPEAGFSDSLMDWWHPGNAQMLGFDGNDALGGENGNDLLDGGSGDDLIGGGLGSDHILGGDGNDYISSSSTLFAPPRSHPGDYWLPPEGQRVLASGARWGIYIDNLPGGGQTTVWGYTEAPTGADPDYVDAGAGNDWVIASGGADRVLGGIGDDILDGLSGDDVLEGGDGKDTLSGDGTIKTGFMTSVAASFHGDDFLDGGAGDDLLIGGGGADVVYGGADNDRMLGDDSGPTNVDYLDLAYHGEDYLDGEDGDDYIEGGGKGDTLYGGAGADILWGDTPAINIGSPADNALMWGGDYLDGEDGDDQLSGGGQDDTLFGGNGDDALWGDESNVLLLGIYHGSDYLDGEAGDDTLTGGGKDDVLYGGIGNDVLKGDDSLSIVPAEFQGLDYLDGEDGNDTLIGGGGDDVLIGGAGNDVLDGGTGADIMEGGLGDDSYIVDNEGDVIVEPDDATAPAASMAAWSSSATGLAFFSASAPTSLTALDAAALPSIDNVESSVSYSLSANLDNLTLSGGAAINGSGNELNNGLFGNGAANMLDGGAGNDFLVGGGGADTLIGGSGDDFYEVSDAATVVVEADGEGLDAVRSSASYTLSDNVEQLQASGIAAINLTGNAQNNALFGNIANNILTGGGGSDYLVGNGGNDVYAFSRGDGQDTISNIDFLRDTANLGLPSAIDSLRFSAGITDADVVGYRSGDHLMLAIKGTTDQVAVMDYYAADLIDGTVTNDHRIDRVEFANGVVWDQAMIQTVVARAASNHAPTVTGSVPPLQAHAGSSFGYTVPQGTITDVDVGDAVVYSAKMQDGSALPAWLAFDSASRSFSGMADVANIGTLQLVLWGTDSYGASAGTPITLAVLEVPDLAPVLLTELPDQEAFQGSVFSYTVPEESFADPDAGDLLSYSASLADGNPLPAWLSFDPDTRSFGGTPTTTGTISVRVAASDSSNLGAADVFDIVVLAPSMDGTPGNDTLTGGTGDDVLKGLAGRDTLYGDAGNDTLDGGLDNDSMNGGNGNDVYRFGRGDGLDTVPAWYDPTVGRLDTLRFKAGVSPADVQLREVYDYVFRTNVALEVFILGSTDKITFNSFLGNDDPSNVQNPLQQIIFDDGTTWDLATIVAKLLAGTPDADTLTGTIAADTLDGQAGADNLSGRGGDDVMNGDADNDVLFGELGNDVLNGGTGNDTLTGGAGLDTLDGGADNDLLSGGADNDTYVFGATSGQDRVVDIAPDGGNIVRLGADITPATLRLLRTGLNGAETMAANDSLVLTVDSTGARLWIDEFFQPAGKSTVSEIRFSDGSGTVWTYADIVSRAGASSTGVQNTQTGTAGNDLFVVDHPADAIVEAVGGGLDTARSSVSYTLPSEVENLELVGDFAFNGTGNASNNVLRGNDGNNVLKGAGGTDQYYGGLGNDTYLHSALPANTAVGLFTVLTPDVFENAGEGYDTLVTDAYSLALPANVERLNVASLMYVYSFTYVVDAPPVYTYVGNGLDNTIDLTGGDFRKFGGINVRIDGGTGNDTMIGSYAYDTYVVDSLGDVVVEPSRGTGQVEASVSYTLGANLADLVLTGAAPIEGTGNQYYNILDGYLNSAANRLVGLDGDDTYRVAVNDVVVEAVGGGNDRVLLLSAVGVVGATVRVSDWANVEGLELGSELGDLTVLGNELNNTIFGSFGANTLQGMDGDDMLSNLNPLSVGLEVSGAHKPYPFQQDHIFGGNGNDTIYSYGGTDVIDGGAGQDAIHLSEVAYATVDGGAGDDVIVSYQGLFDLRLGAGSDHDTASASGTRLAADWAAQHNISSTISLTAGTDASNLRFTRDGASLVVGLNGGADTVTVPDFFESAVSTAIQSRLDAIRLTDGTVLTRDAMAAGMGRTDLQTGTAGDDLLITTATTLVLAGGLGNDQIFGQGTNDDLDGGAGDDRLFGGDGSDQLTGGVGSDGLTGGHGADTYQFSLGWGTDVVDEMQATEVQATISGRMADDGAVDAIDFDGTVAVADIAATMVGVDLVLTHRTNGDSIKVLNYFDATATQAGQVELIRFADGTVWDQAYVARLGSTFTGTDADDTLIGLAYVSSELFGLAGNDTLYAGMADDLLDGGLGGDQMYASVGNDRYVVDNAADLVGEYPGEGTDTVLASIGYTLTADVENLTLTGTAAINGTGNTLANVLTGNIANNTLSGGTGADTMAGGLGDDSYVVDNVADVVTEALNEGIDLVQSSVTYTLGGNVEKLTLTGSSAIKGTGNTLDNVLTGNSGANVLTGGTGNDTYIVGTGDSTVELAGGGIDVVQSAVTWTLGAEVENLTLTGTTAINGTGNASANRLTGNSAANTLNGAAGADTLLGGAGNDTYVVDNVADVVTENAAEGTDLVQSSVSYTLGAEVEKLTLTGTTAINGTGNSLANTLTGNSGANVLDGEAGADTLVGGTGNDTYMVDNAGDVTTEAASAGTDTVLASLNWTLATNLEKLTLTGTANINATGNSVANVLTGNAGDNVLTGGAGNDTLVGGAGNDTYVLDVATDVVTEALNAGTDTVQTGVTYTLGINVENLTLTGSSAIKATGNALANVLTGNSGANVMTGGAGNDTYVVGTGDSAVEAAGGGTDTVQSAITWTLGTELENLTLTGSSAVNGTGNTLANVMMGNSGNNTLTGAAGNDTLDGGAGVDILVGGTGNDTFRLGRGYGADTSQENDATAGNTDVLQFLSGVAIDQVWFRHVGNNLEVSIIGTGDKMTLTNWYSGANYHVEQLTTADGKVLQDSQVEALVTAMAPYAAPALGQLTLPADYWTALSAVITGNWH